MLLVCKSLIKYKEIIYLTIDNTDHPSKIEKEVYYKTKSQQHHVTINSVSVLKFILLMWSVMRLKKFIGILLVYRYVATST